MQKAGQFASLREFSIDELADDGSSRESQDSQDCAIPLARSLEYDAPQASECWDSGCLRDFGACTGFDLARGLGAGCGPGCNAWVFESVLGQVVLISRDFASVLGRINSSFHTFDLESVPGQIEISFCLQFQIPLSLSDELSICLRVQIFFCLWVQISRCL